MRMHLKKKKKFKLFLVLIIVIFYFSFLLIRIYSNKIVPFFLSYAEIETRKIISNIISECVAEKFDKVDLKKISTINYNSKGEIISFNFDTYLTNKELSKITDEIENRLLKLENDNDINKNTFFISIPFGIMNKSFFLANLNPKVPVKLSFVGNATSNFVADVKEYGINNAIVKLSINVRVRCNILLPIAKKSILVENNIPIVMELIPGKIPNYYGSEFKKNSLIS